MAENAGTIYSDVRIQLDKLRGDIKGVQSTLNGFKNFNQTSAKTTQTQWNSTFKGMNLAGTAAAIAITASFKKMIGTFATTEQSLANVRAVTGATAEEFKALEDAATIAGQTTRFTAGQAADALYYLASAGFDATQSIDALDGVLLLAGATGSDLAMTSETLASAISAFNLEAEDSARVANVFAAAIGNSQATMDKLAVSMRYVGPVASAFNQSIEGTVGLLQILYNNGFEASQAGTALRSALADLANAASPANARLKELGVNFDEINPQTNSYADIIDVLQNKVTDASDVMQIFGDRAGPALIKLIEAGRSEVEKYTKAVTGTNAAAEQYAIQNDTLAGSFDMFKSAAEAASNSIIKELAPTLRDLLGIGIKVLNFINGLPGPLKALAGGAGGAAAVIGTLSVAMRVLGISAGAAFGPIGILITVLSGLAFAIGSAAQEERKFNKEINDTYKQIDNIDTGAASLTTELAVLQSKTKLTTEEQKKQKELLTTLNELYPELSEKVLENARAVATQRIEQAKANKQALQDQVTTLQKIRVGLEKEQEKQLEGVKKSLRKTAQAYYAYLDPEVAVKRINEFNRELENTTTAEGFIQIAKRIGASEQDIGLNFVYTGEKIKETDKAIDDVRRTMSTLDGEIGTNTVKLAGLADEFEKTGESAEKGISKALEYSQKLLEKQKDNDKTYAEGYQEELDKIVNAHAEAEELKYQHSKARREKEKQEEEDLKQKILDTYNALKTGYQQISSAITGFLNQNIANQQSELENFNAVNGKELDGLQERIDAGKALTTAEKERYDLLKKEQRKFIMDKYDAELAAFRANKAVSLINTGISTAEGAIAAYKALAGIPVVGPALGAAAAAAITGFGIAQGALIASQPEPKPPALQTGGIILPKKGGTTAVLAENGSPELALNLGQEGSALLDEFARRVNGNNNGGKIQNITFVMDKNVIYSIVNKGFDDVKLFLTERNIQ